MGQWMPFHRIFPSNELRASMLKYEQALNNAGGNLLNKVGKAEKKEITMWKKHEDFSGCIYLTRFHG